MSVSKRTWTHKGITKEAWVVRYTDQRGKRRLKTFGKKKGADKYRIQVESEIEKGEHVPETESSTVKSLAEAYMRYYEERVRAGTIGKQHYRNTITTAVNKYIIPFFGRKLITEVTLQDVEDWYRWSMSARRLAGATIQGYMRVLVQIEAHAIKRHHAKRAVMAEGCREFRQAPAKPIRTFTAAEIEQLLSATDKRPRNYTARAHQLGRCCVHLAAFCGLRWGEIAGLSLQQVDFHRRMIRVRQSLTCEDELKLPKTRAGVRDVPMAPHIVQILQQWTQLYYIENDRQLLFRSGQYRSSTLRPGFIYLANFHSEFWRPLLDRAGLGREVVGDHIHFHALRHFFGSWLIEHGMSLTEVAALLGHSSFDMTLQTYAHPIMGGTGRHEIMDQMANNLLPPAANIAAIPA